MLLSSAGEVSEDRNWLFENTYNFLYGQKTMYVGRKG